MQCRHCGAVNDPKNETCVLCGKTIVNPAEAEQKDPEPVQAPPVPVLAAPRELTQEEHIRIGELIYAAYKHKESGAMEDAIVACQGALALNDRSGPAHSLLGSLYESKGDIPSAIYQFEKVQALDPGNVANLQKLDSLRQTPRPVSAGDWSAPFGKWKFPIPLKFDRLVPYVPIIVPVIIFIGVLVVLLLTVGRNQGRAVQEGERFITPGNMPQTTPPVQPGAQPFLGQGQQNPMTQQQPYLGPGQLAPQGPGQASTEGQPNDNSPQRTGPVHVPVPKSGVVTGSHSATPLPTVNPQPVVRPIQPPPAQPPVMTPIVEQPRPAQPRPSNPPAPAPKPKPTPAPQSTDPEARAMQYQQAGKYSEAVSSYREALSRTSDSGRIHQQIALCYQRLGQRDQAVSSYRSAIRSYRDQLSAGRDASEVQRNIRSCEAGIDVLANQDR